jgi:hypothetical protein
MHKVKQWVYLLSSDQVNNLKLSIKTDKFNNFVVQVLGVAISIGLVGL